MTVLELSQRLMLKTIYIGDGSREINEFFCCDLHTHTYARIKDNSAWITVMTGVNTAAVAYAKKLSCVILADNMIPTDDFLARAMQFKINILSSELNEYELCSEISAIENTSCLEG